MDPSKILNKGMLCRHCSQLIPINDKNHKCSASTGQAMYKFKKIEHKMSSYPKPSTSKPSLLSDFLTEIESEELNIPPSNLSENTSDDDDNEFYSSLIAEVNERNPLWDHRLPMAARYEPIKQNLWNEIYVALNGIYSIDVLKKKWKYLREKFVREKKNLQVVLLEGKGKYGAT
ncbi:MADF domain-containing protein [Aphis craccivora]|uniref:MADF domain-containing protein n=1 Tax=Aphis craccivora TaxID=307492 RepID=A0A6G0W1R1_APHCR|nr:MADF domain-containing protein [Aphis craccivora]